VAEHPIEGAFQPAGVGYKYIMISPKLMKDAGLNIGDVVEMRFRVADQNAVDVPPELLEALAANDAAQTVWDTLTVGKKRGFSFLVETAKQRATKSKRCAQILEELAINGAKATPQLRGKKR
ncbi:MAG: YdeI/OmpD-associated family protein, partial [Pseudomonadota bacterium]